jgi:hypothetical protein
VEKRHDTIRRQNIISILPWSDNAIFFRIVFEDWEFTFENRCFSMVALFIVCVKGVRLNRGIPLQRAGQEIELFPKNEVLGKPQ